MESLSNDLLYDGQTSKPRKVTKVGDSIFERTNGSGQTDTFVKVGTVKQEFTGLVSLATFPEYSSQTDEQTNNYLYIGGCSKLNTGRYYVNRDTS